MRQHAPTDGYGTANLADGDAATDLNQDQCKRDSGEADARQMAKAVQPLERRTV